MKADQQKRRAALTQPPAVVAVPVAQAPAVKNASIVHELEAAAMAAMKRGDHAAHAALTEILNAAGLLRAKAATRVHDLHGSDAELAKKVHALL